MVCCWRYSSRCITYIGELAVDISLSFFSRAEQSRAEQERYQVYIYICNFLPVRAEFRMDASEQKKKKKKKRGNAFVVVAPLL